MRSGDRERTLSLMRKALHVAAALLAAAAQGSIVRDCNAQTERAAAVIEDPRPVGDAIRRMLRVSGAPISYEDPRYVFVDDIRDASEYVRGDSPARPVTVPRGGRLEYSYDIDADTGRLADPVAAVQSLVEANNAQSFGGKFVVLRSDGFLHVVPTAVRDANGRWAEQTSVLDARVSVTAEGNALDLLEAILREVSRQGGTPVGLAPEGFVRGLWSYRGRVQTNNEIARDVLRGVLQDIGSGLSWLLYYDPTGDYYFFNIVAAAPPRRPDDGGVSR